METNKQKTNWIIDAVLAIGFWLCFFLDLTGLSLHQWLGIAVGALAGYHTLAHWDWVTSVTRRFWGRASRRARLFYLIDASMLLGLSLIVVSGMVISTWLALSLDNYAAWKNFHIIASIATLLVMVLKLTLHWRWIALVARRYVFASPATRTPQPVPASSGLDRREFLKWMGLVGAVSVLALGSTLKDGGNVLANGLSTDGLDAGTSGSGLLASPTSTACSVRCNRKCSYPGHCHRYVDSNGNNRCDQGECIG